MDRLAGVENDAAVHGEFGERVVGHKPGNGAALIDACGRERQEC